MFPILYEQISAGVVPQHHGLGTLSDAITCEVEQARNGIYELVMTYPATGIHAQEIAQRRVLKVKPNFTDVPQLFRIDRIGKTMNGIFTVYAKHISYDLSGYVISEGSANNAASACQLLTNATKATPESNPDFTIATDKQVAAIFTVNEPASVKSFFAGKEGSLLDVYGTGEWKYNNFTATLMLHAGVVEPRTTIRYGKNLLELSQEIDSSNLYTHVLCYYKSSENIIVSGEKQATGLSLDLPKTLVVDVSSEYENEPTVEQLNSSAQHYISTHNLIVPNNNITLDFVQSGELTNRVDLCDNVNIYYEALGITRASVKCIRTKWDCIREKYIETEFGDVKQNLADTISQAALTISELAGIADNKKRVFINQPVPPYDVGDLWVNDGTIYYCVEGKKDTIIKEAEGEIVSFNTLQMANLLECKAGINFVQAGSGTPSPDNVRPITGYNEANITRMGKNLLKNTVEDNHSGNVSWVVNDDKSITFTGTASSTVFVPLADAYYLPAGPYTMNKSGYSGIQCLLRIGSISGNDVFWSTELNDRTATINAGLYFPLIRIASGTNTDGITIYPQMQAGETASDYVPYDAGETFNVDIRINKGINIWDEDWESGGIDTDTGLPVTDNSKIRSKNFTEVEPNTDYYFVYKDGNLVVIFYDENYAVISYTGRGLKTTPANCHYVKLRMGSMASPVTEYAYNTSINYPATNTSYHAHNGDPVYKGELNVTTGELTLSHAFIDLGDLSYSKTGILYSKYAFVANVDNLKPVTNTADYIDAVCESYTIRSGNQVYSAWEGLSAWSTQQKIGIYDSTKESLTASEFKTAVSGIKLVYELNEPITINVDANDIETLLFNNIWNDTNGDMYVKYMFTGFASDDWQLATDFVDEANLEDSIRNATQIITGGLGGNVIINYRDVTVDGQITQRPYEILILCDADNIDDATQLWRWNAGGLGYSQTGYDGEYGTAMSVDPITGKGYINADFITVGTLDASLVTIQDLTATMFTGNTIVLGGSDNSKLEVQDASGNPLIRINKNGMECFAATVNNITPSVVFDKNGVTGYSNSADKENTAIFWTKKDNFHMVNAVIENEASFGGKIRFVPITVGNFEGIAVVPVIDN